MTSLLHRIAADQTGTSVIEFAIIGPAFIAVLVATVQTALVFLAQQGLETVAEDAARVLMTGQAQQTSMTAAQFKTKACTSLPPFMTCDKLMLDVKQVNSFNSATLAAPTITYNNTTGAVTNAFSYDVGGRNAIVVVRAMYLWPVVGGILNFDLSDQDNGTRLLLSTSVLKTELY